MELPPQPGIKLIVEPLDELFTRAGIRGFRDKARYLGIGQATLHRAYQGEPVGAPLIYGIRTRWPRVPYSRLFREDAPDRAGVAA